MVWRPWLASDSGGTSAVRSAVLTLPTHRRHPSSWLVSAKPTLGGLLVDVDELVLIVPGGRALGRTAPGAPSPAVAVARALDHDFMALARTAAVTRRVSAGAEASGRTLRIRVQVRRFDAMCRKVAAGLGLAILPHAAAARGRAFVRAGVRSADRAPRRPRRAPPPAAWPCDAAPPRCHRPWPALVAMA